MNDSCDFCAYGRPGVTKHHSNCPNQPGDAPGRYRTMMQVGEERKIEVSIRPQSSDRVTVWVYCGARSMFSCEVHKDDFTSMTEGIVSTVRRCLTDSLL